MDRDQEIRGIIGRDAYAEYFAYYFENLGITAGATGTIMQDATIRIDTDAPFAVQSRTFQATDTDLYIQMLDQGTGRTLFNTRRHVRTVAGQPVAGSSVGLNATESLFSPFPLMAPYLIQPGTALTLQAADASSGTNNLRLTLHGGKIRKGRAPWDYDFKDRYQYDYGNDPAAAAVTANGTLVCTIPIQQDAHFLVRSITGIRTSGSCYMLIRDTATQKAWMNTEVFIDQMVGNAASPNVLPSPRMVERGTAIEVLLRDTSGSTNTVLLNFHGEKLIE